MPGPVFSNVPIHAIPTGGSMCIRAEVQTLPIFSAGRPAVRASLAQNPHLIGIIPDRVLELCDRLIV